MELFESFRNCEHGMEERKELPKGSSTRCRSSHSLEIILLGGLSRQDERHESRYREGRRRLSLQHRNSWFRVATRVDSLVLERCF